MKFKIAVALCALLQSVSFASEPIKTSSSIKHVTLYVQGAEINRSSSVDLPKGESEVHFIGLTNSIDPNTIQIGGNGDFTIMGVSHYLDYLNAAPKSKLQLTYEDSVVYLNEKIQKEQEYRSVLQSEKTLVMANQQMKGTNSTLTAEELESMANFFRTRLTELSEKLFQSNKQERAYVAERTRIQQQLNGIQVKRNTSTGVVVVTVKAEKTTNANFDLSFISRNAGWVPSYEVRGGEVDAAVNLTYNANVQQSTGIDWKDVKLTLSTGHPLVNNTKPTLNPWVLNFIQSYDKLSSYDYSYMNSRAVEDVELNEVAGVSNADKRKAKEVSSFTTMVENQLTVDFEINELYTIPSSNQRKLVQVQKMELPAMYEHTAIPKLDKEAFLLARITGWDEFNLMPGSANLYFQGTYIGQSYIDPLTTFDTLNISMGRDRQIVLSRERITEMCETSTFGGSKKETMAIKLKVRNTKNSSVQLHLKDQIPISRNNDITIKLISKSKAAYDEEKGFLDWDLTLEPGETQELIIKYEVKFPKDKKINL